MGIRPAVCGVALKYGKLAKRFAKKRAFITGAAAGLGFAFSSALARDGWTLGITDIDSDALQNASAQLTLLGGTIYSYKFDVSDYDAYSVCASQFLQSAGGIDLLINNAGIGCGGYVEELSVEMWQRVININLMGAIYGCKLFLPYMKSHRSGHIINLASAAAIAAPPQSAPYNISKAGMVSLTESLYNELTEFGIGTSVFAPTFIKTNIGTSTVGTPAVRARAEVAVSKSKLTPDWAVHEVYSAVEAGKVYIVRPTLIQTLWLFKRLLPETYLKAIEDYCRKMTASLDASAARRAEREKVSSTD